MRFRGVASKILPLTSALKILFLTSASNIRFRTMALKMRFRGITLKRIGYILVLTRMARMILTIVGMSHHHDYLLHIGYGAAAGLTGRGT